MTCKKCGAEVASGNVFCTQCGYQFLPPLPNAVYMYYFAAIVFGCLLSLLFDCSYHSAAVSTLPFMPMILFCFIPLFNFKKMIPGIVIASICYSIHFDIRTLYHLRGREKTIITEVFHHYSSRYLVVSIIGIVLLFITAYFLKKYTKYRLLSYTIVTVYVLVNSMLHILSGNVWLKRYGNSRLDYLFACGYPASTAFKVKHIRDQELFIIAISITLCLLGLYLGKLIHSWLSQRYDI